MFGCMTIDYRPGPRAVPRILEIVDEEGFDLAAIQRIPCASDRCTLKLELAGFYSNAELYALEQRLLMHGSVIQVVHHAHTAARAQLVSAELH